MSVFEIILISGLVIGSIYLLCQWIKYKEGDCKYINTLHEGSNILITYYDKCGWVDSWFRATVINIDKNKNRCRIRYTDGSESSEEILRFIGLREQGWKILD